MKLESVLTRSRGMDKGTKGSSEDAPTRLRVGSNGIQSTWLNHMTK